MKIKLKNEDRIFHEICEQLEIRGELVNNVNAFRTMVSYLKNLRDSETTLQKENSALKHKKTTLQNENSALKHKIELYEQNATLLFQINQPTATREFVIDCLNTKDLTKKIEEVNSKKKYFRNPSVQSFEPTYAKPYQYIVTDNTTWLGFNDYEDALKTAVKYEQCTIWALAWDKYKGDWKLCNVELFCDGKFLNKTDYDYLHYGTLNSFLYNGNK